MVYVVYVVVVDVCVCKDMQTNVHALLLFAHIKKHPTHKTHAIPHTLP